MRYKPQATAKLLRFAPVVFVVIWSTGFVVAKYSMPYAEPFTFLALRMGLTSLIFIPIIWFSQDGFSINWRRSRHDAVVGLLLHTGYLGAYFAAIRVGADAGTSAIIVGVQPILTALLAVLLLNESMTRFKVMGFLLGFAGTIFVVVSQKGVVLTSGASESVWIFIWPVVSLSCISLALIYQKKYSGQSLLNGTWVQYLAATLSCIVIARMLGESGTIQWSTTFVLALAWQVVGLSIAAVLLLVFMIEQGEASRVSSLFYLVPPLVVIEAYFLFSESLSLWAGLGLILSMIGVLMIRRQ